jgi:hypothetical protein
MFIKEWDPQWKIRPYRRTAFGDHPKMPGWLFKYYDSAPGSGHPMANTLRVPMAEKMRAVVKSSQLSQLHIPKKALVPLFPSKDINTLNEVDINYAYVVMAQKVEMLPREEMFALVKNNELLAEQICQLSIQTGYGDCAWTNFGMMPLDNTVVVYDTEPLYWELGVEHDATDQRFERNDEIIASKGSHLGKCVLRGLEEFRRTSQENDLEVHENAARKHIEALSD